MCDDPPENAHSYVRECLFKYLRMLGQSASVEISQAAYDWQQYLSTRTSLVPVKPDPVKHMNTQVITIEYRGEIVGSVQNAMPDMWQTEGDWLAGESALTPQFEALATGADAVDVVENVRTGKVIRCHVDDGEPYMAYVIGLTDNRLVFRKFSSLQDVLRAERETREHGG